LPLFPTSSTKVHDRYRSFLGRHSGVGLPRSSSSPLERQETAPGETEGPLRRFELPDRLTYRCHQQYALLSWSSLGLQRVCSTLLATVLVSSLPLWPWSCGLAFEVFAAPSAWEEGFFPDDPLMTFRSPTEYDRSGAVRSRISPETNCLPCGFCPYDVRRSG
jgi:hypothetical protein